MANFTKDNYISSIAPPTIYNSLIKRKLLLNTRINQTPGFFNDEPTPKEEFSVIKMEQDLIYNIDVNYFSEEVILPFKNFPFYRLCLFIEGDFIDEFDSEVTIGKEVSDSITITVAYSHSGTILEQTLTTDQYELYVEKISDILHKVVVLIDPALTEDLFVSGEVKLEMPIDTISEINAMVF